MSKNMDQIDKFIQERIIEENIEDVFASRFARYQKRLFKIVHYQMLEMD